MIVIKAISDIMEVSARFLLHLEIARRTRESYHHSIGYNTLHMFKMSRQSYVGFFAMKQNDNQTARTAQIIKI